MNLRTILLTAAAIAGLVIVGCSSQHTGSVAPMNTTQRSALSAVQPATESQAEAEYQRVISGANQPPRTEEYAIDAYYVAGDGRGVVYPADVTIRRALNALYVVSKNGHMDKYPANSKVTLMPRSMHLFVHPGESRPDILNTAIAHRVR
jgi:hypothetical protein